MATESELQPSPSPRSSDLFDLLSDETRIDILLLLGESAEALSFSEVARHLNIDDTGRLNYHLGRLRGRLVERHAEGYGLTEEGRTVLGWLR